QTPHPDTTSRHHIQTPHPAKLFSNWFKSLKHRPITEDMTVGTESQYQHLTDDELPFFGLPLDLPPERLETGEPPATKPTLADSDRDLAAADNWASKSLTELKLIAVGDIMDKWTKAESLSSPVVEVTNNTKPAI
ncbi:hypothetical protein WICPIJ_009831, partial [Wickerhamomyces pijperi]